MEPSGYSVAQSFHVVVISNPVLFHYMQYVLTMMLFFRAETGIRITLLMYIMISIYGMITSRANRVIWDVYSELLSCPGELLSLGIH